MKIGLLLGSFDPIHIAHINIASSVLNSALCDKVVFVVAKQNPWKEHSPIPFDLRCEMIRAAVSAFGDKCEVCTLEREIEPPTYSYKVLSLIRKQCPNDELFIICGSDAYNGLSHWKNYETHIKDHFKVILIKRYDKEIITTNNDNQFEIIQHENGICEVISSPIITSSTMIRNMVAKGMIPIPYVTKEVYEIIKRCKLYTNGKTNV